MSVDRPETNRQGITRNRESDRGPGHVLAAVIRTRVRPVTEGPIPRKAGGDAAHIAVATVYSCEYLLTWNCRHIANAELHRSIRRVLEQHGYEVPTLCTPEELLG